MSEMSKDEMSGWLKDRAHQKIDADTELTPEESERRKERIDEYIDSEVDAMYANRDGSDVDDEGDEGDEGEASESIGSKQHTQYAQEADDRPRLSL